MNVVFPPGAAPEIASMARALGSSARVLGAFGEHDPGLASECGVELGALEARTILASGAPDRILAAAEEAFRTGRPFSVAPMDMEAIGRLEGVVARGLSGISLKMAALDAEERQAPVARLGNIVGLVTGAVGLVKSIF